MSENTKNLPMFQIFKIFVQNVDFCTKIVYSVFKLKQKDG